MNKLSDCYVLKNGVEIPCLGYGTWKAPESQTTVNSVRDAITAGYKHIDAAAAYENEEYVGEGIEIGLSENNLKREDIFITSKLNNPDHGYESTLRAFDKTLKDLKLDYLDMYLIHWPMVRVHGDEYQTYVQETWRAFEKLYEEGKIRAIGVCNFKKHHLEPLMEKAKIMPMVNQIEIHPGMPQEETVAFCREKEIVVEAWSPLGSGRIFTIDLMKEIANRYNCSIAQICLRWCIQKGVLPLAKSVHTERIIENTKIFDFVLSDEDMKLLDTMENLAYSGLDPDLVNF